MPKSIYEKDLNGDIILYRVVYYIADNREYKSCHTLYNFKSVGSYRKVIENQGLELGKMPLIISMTYVH